MATASFQQSTPPHRCSIPGGARMQRRFQNLLAHRADFESTVSKQLGRSSFVDPNPILVRRQVHSSSSKRTLCRRHSLILAATVSGTAVGDVSSMEHNSEQRGSLLRAPVRAWESWWALGRNPKVEKTQRFKKLGPIVSKLWKIMNVNCLLFTAALFCMVRCPALCR